MEKRNLVLLHLESLNNLVYRTNRHLFKNLNRIEKKSLFFEKYFSTATSTLMVLGDLFYGGMEQYEQCEALDYIPTNYMYKSSLFDDLKGEGYNVKIFVFPDGSDRESAEERHIAGFDNKMILIPDYSCLVKEIKKSMEKEPFAVNVCNYISNLALSHLRNTEVEFTGFDNWKNGYIELDKCVGTIFDILEEKGLLDNTTVVLYGDHGDDYWGHGYHKGLTHAIEPYAMLVHTPMFIYDSRITPGINSNVMSTTDMRRVIKALLQNDDVSLMGNYERKYAVARTSYAAQPIRYDSFKKAYSITDGELLLLVSPDGLELYNIEMDPACIYNFLNEFCFDGNIIWYNEEINSNVKFHYRYFASSRQISYLQQKFYFLRANLYVEVEKLYEAAGKTVTDMVQEMEFDKIYYNCKM